MYRLWKNNIQFFVSNNLKHYQEYFEKKNRKNQMNHP